MYPTKGHALNRNCCTGQRLLLDEQATAKKFRKSITSDYGMRMRQRNGFVCPLYDSASLWISSQRIRFSGRERGVFSQKCLYFLTQLPLAYLEEMQSIQESFQNMARAVEQELESIRERAKVHERQLRDALDEVRLLRRKEAAELLGMSNSALDRMVASGELKAVYLDSCPRFQLIELKRVIEVSRTSQTRRRKSCGRS